MKQMYFKAKRLKQESVLRVILIHTHAQIDKYNHMGGDEHV